MTVDVTYWVILGNRLSPSVGGVGKNEFQWHVLVAIAAIRTFYSPGRSDSLAQNARGEAER
jgi:hypothetical protein